MISRWNFKCKCNLEQKKRDLSLPLVKSLLLNLPFKSFHYICDHWVKCSLCQISLRVYIQPYRPDELCLSIFLIFIITWLLSKIHSLFPDPLPLLLVHVFYCVNTLLNVLYMSVSEFFHRHLRVSWIYI